MGWCDEKGKWHPFGSSTVKDAYWAVMNPEGKQVDKNGFVIPKDVPTTRSKEPSPILHRTI